MITFLFYRAWRPLNDAGVLILPAIAAMITATVEEWFQWFIPGRVGVMDDVFLNWVAIACGLLFSIAVDPPPAPPIRLSRATTRHAALTLAIFVVVFGMFFDSVHVGHEIRDPSVGTFTSIYTEAELHANAADRTQRWAIAPPLDRTRLAREDQYRTEGIQHVQERNRAWDRGNADAAWRENLILERYYAPVMNHGHAWPPEQRRDAETRAATSRESEYASAAYPYRIYAWSKVQLWAGILGAVAVMLLVLNRGSAFAKATAGSPPTNNLRTSAQAFRPANSRGPTMALLDRALDHANEYLDTLRERPVISAERDSALRRRLGGPVPEQPSDPESVLDALALAGVRGTVATAGPRYYGFVTGGSLPIAMAADWLASAWDQNVGLSVMSPLGGAVETVAADWLLEILELPRSASVGFVTGAHMANVTALAVARHQVLRQAGWDVEADGLQGAPRVTVLAGTEAHSSIGAACRLVGLGVRTIMRVPSDDQGRIMPEALSAALQSSSGPRIVCAQAGNVNTGACDPFPAIVRAVREYNAWLHVDGAFGLWAAAAPDRRHLVDGLSGADSWTTDGHKWLNVPYDSGIVIVAHPAAHRAAMSQTAA